MIVIAVAMAIGAACAPQFYLESMNRYTLTPPKKEPKKERELRDPRLQAERPLTCGQVAEQQATYALAVDEYKS